MYKIMLAFTAIPQHRLVYRFDKLPVHNFYFSVGAATDIIETGIP
jgi:hypothetical protein